MLLLCRSAATPWRRYPRESALRVPGTNHNIHSTQIHRETVTRDQNGSFRLRVDLVILRLAIIKILVMINQKII